MAPNTQEAAKVVSEDKNWLAFIEALDYEEGSFSYSISQHKYNLR